VPAHSELSDFSEQTIDITLKEVILLLAIDSYIGMTPDERVV